MANRSRHHADLRRNSCLTLTRCFFSPMFLTDHHKQCILNSKTVQSIHLWQQVATANPTHETLWYPAHRIRHAVLTFWLSTKGALRLCGEKRERGVSHEHAGTLLTNAGSHYSLTQLEPHRPEPPRP